MNSISFWYYEPISIGTVFIHGGKKYKVHNYYEFKGRYFMTAVNKPEDN